MIILNYEYTILQTYKEEEIQTVKRLSCENTKSRKFKLQLWTIIKIQSCEHTQFERPNKKLQGNCEQQSFEKKK